MFGKNTGVTSLQSRKQLLIAESELNRAQLVEDTFALKADIRAFAHRAKSFDSIASSAAMLVAGLAAFRRGKSSDAAVKPSWLQTILKGASLVSTAYLAFRPAKSQSDIK
jgi:hypothetical protein